MFRSPYNHIIFLEKLRDIQETPEAISLQLQCSCEVTCLAILVLIYIQYCRHSESGWICVGLRFICYGRYTYLYIYCRNVNMIGLRGPTFSSY